MIEKMIILLGLLAGLNADAALSDLDKSVAAPRGNMLTNPGFEAGRGAWTASGGTFVTTNAAANKFAGAATGSWDSSSASQTLTASSVAITSGNGLSGANITGGCYFKVAGAYTGKVQLFDGTNVLAEASISNNTSGFTPTYVTGSAPASGTVSLRFISVASDEPIVYPDDCYLGRADGFNLSQVSQATLYGTLKYATTTNCLWSVSSAAAFTSFAADTDCPTATVTGGVSAPTTKVPGVRLQNLPPGNYAFYVTNFFQKQNAASEEYALRFFDGTNGFSPQGAIAASDAGQTSLYGFVSYTAAQSDITVQLQAIRNSANALSIRGDTRDFEISIYRFPTSSETAARVDSLPASWSGYHDNTCSFTNSSTGSYGDFSGDASCALVQTNNTNFGTVTSYLNGGNNSSGLVFTPQKPGAFLVTATTSASNSSGAQVASIALTDGSNTVLSAQSFRVINTGYEHTFALSGIVYATSLSAVTAKLRGKVTGGTTTIDVDATQRVSWSVVALSQSFPAPLLVGSVTSSSSGLERVERAVIGTTNRNTGCSAGTCTVFDSSSSWITATRSGAGTYTYTMSGFTGVPVCTCSPNRNAAVHSSCQVTSATNVDVLTASTAGSNQDEPVSIRCQGPR